ncbi:hypothetical protein ALP75_203135 [Pseudomonas syringae pv. actinidiae]|nr:hypothetical protein ALP75_203135 [Pseudomonas syringae pv. actinidiae]
MQRGCDLVCPWLHVHPATAVHYNNGFRVGFLNEADQFRLKLWQFKRVIEGLAFVFEVAACGHHYSVVIGQIFRWTQRRPAHLHAVQTAQYRDEVAPQSTIFQAHVVLGAGFECWCFNGARNDRNQIERDLRTFVFKHQFVIDPEPVGTVGTDLDHMGAGDRRFDIAAETGGERTGRRRVAADGSCTVIGHVGVGGPVQIDTRLYAGCNRGAR